jgi:rRNA maturation RNase YbeY
MERVARLHRTRPWDELAVVLTDDAGIAGINRECFGRPGVTDVIVCEYEPVPGEEGRFSAEIVVNLQRAVENGRRLGRAGGHRHWGPDRELALYIAHGCDHLSGEDDRRKAGRMRMRRRELRWLRQAAAAGLLEGLVATDTRHATRDTRHPKPPPAP